LTVCSRFLFVVNAGESSSTLVANNEDGAASELRRWCRSLRGSVETGPQDKEFEILLILGPELRR
jgi:hypothetical protein